MITISPEFVMLLLVILLQLVNALVWGRSNGRQQRDIEQILARWEDKLRKQADRTRDKAGTETLDLPQPWRSIEEGMKKRGEL